MSNNMPEIYPLDVCPVCYDSHSGLQLRLLVCKSCFNDRIPEQGRKVSLISFVVPCSVCEVYGSAQEVILRICFSCQSDAVKASKLSFLQQFDPPPLSSDFTGDISLSAKGSGQTVKAHRFVLAGKSPVFRKMMEINMREKLSGEIHLEDISADVLRAVVNFMYTAEIAFTSRVTPQEVFRFAHQYEIQTLKQLCENELGNSITVENVVELLRVAYLFEGEILKQKATKFFTEHPNVHRSVLDAIFESSVPSLT